MKKLLFLSMIATSLIHADGSELIKKEQYGDQWAFTVDQVTIGCEMSLPFVAVEGDHFVYGITGYAAQQIGRSIDGIWRDDPKIKGLKVQLQPFIDKALEHCD